MIFSCLLYAAMMMIQKYSSYIVMLVSISFICIYVLVFIIIVRIDLMREFWQMGWSCFGDISGFL